MSGPSANAFVLRGGTVTIGGTDYSNEVYKARLVPEVNVQTQRTFDPTGTFTDIDTPVWTLELTGLQSKSASAGLSDYLTDHYGESVTFVLTPRTGGVSASGSFIALPTEFGGTQGETANFELELQVSGQPVRY